jgi:hypothetical protein
VFGPQIATILAGWTEGGGAVSPVADLSSHTDARKGFVDRVEKKLGLASLVLLAQNHNPSILSPDFLGAKKIVEGPPSSFAHTPVVSVVEYAEKHLAINVTADRFTANFSGNITDESVAATANIVRSYFACLPETPINAVGINFHGELTFQSEEELAGFQARWFRPSGLSDYLKGIANINWGATAKFVLPETKALVTLKVEPSTNPLVMSLLVNGHYDVKGTAQSIDVLKQGPIDILAFSTRMMSEL